MKNVLLGIAVVALLVPASFAAEQKYYEWESLGWKTQFLHAFPVKLKVPWFIMITNEKDWELEIVQYMDPNPVQGERACAKNDADPAKSLYPCFGGCRDLVFKSNFNFRLECKVVAPPSPAVKPGGDWKCKLIPNTLNAPGGTSSACVWVEKLDLLFAPPDLGKKVTVATLEIWVAPI